MLVADAIFSCKYSEFPVLSTICQRRYFFAASTTTYVTSQGRDFLVSDCEDLIRRMLCVDSDQRIDIRGIVTHKWIQAGALLAAHNIFL